MDIRTAVEKYMDQEGLHSIEGQRGVKNLAKLVNALGYQDINRYGQEPGGFCMGDIFAFLEDNPGAIEAVIDWVKSRRHIPEWTGALTSQLADSTDEDDVENEDTEWDNLEPPIV